MQSRCNQSIWKTGGLDMDNSGREWLISMICLIVILFASANPLSACPPPSCGDCQKWDANVPGCVDDDDQDTTGGDTGTDPDKCGYCQKCSSGACANDDAAGNTDDVCSGAGAECTSCLDGACESDCAAEWCCDVDVCVSSCTTGCCDDGLCASSCSGSKCCEDSECVSSCTSGCCDDGECESSCPEGQCCEDGTCVSSCSSGCCDDGTCVSSCGTWPACCDDGECVDHCSYIEGKECCGGNCITECDASECMECDHASGTCVSECSGTTPHCNFGMCVECRDRVDCEICEDCVGFDCVHPCDNCVYPKYCGSACSCVECSYGEEDTATCSTTQSTTGCDCSVNLVSPCSSGEESVVYSGNPLRSCTGPDCESTNVLCYTTYQTCTTSGGYAPLEWCLSHDVGAPPPAPWPHSCGINLDLPGPGCYTCANSFNAGVQVSAPEGRCPTEHWP